MTPPRAGGSPPLPLRVLLAGGGSGGSATPLLAVAEALQQRLDGNIRLLYVGTARGPERALAARVGLPFVAVRAGRLRRYLDWRHLVDPFLLALGCLDALAVVRRFRPHVACSAGGFAAVPPTLAARALGVPALVHQQDLEAGLANRLLAPLAGRVTLAFPASRVWFPRGVVTGNPVRRAILGGDAARARARFGLAPDLPTLLVTGGGTGALALNRLVAQAAPLLADCCQIVHLTGRGKGVAPSAPRYHPVEFVTEEMADLWAAADLVLCRAGMGTLSELAALGKAAILVPMPRSHQEANAAVFAAAGAALVRDQASLTPALLAASVRELLADQGRREDLGARAQALLPPGAADRVAAELIALAARRR